MAKRMNVVFDDESLYLALKVEGARRGVPVKDIVAAALEMWFEAQEDTEDIAASQAALSDYRVQGGVPASEVHEEIRTILREREPAP